MSNEVNNNIIWPPILDEIRRAYDLAQTHRQNEQFGDAINEFQKVIELVDQLERDATSSNEVLSEDIRMYKEKAKASISLIKDIRFFVNADLMNP